MLTTTAPGPVLRVTRRCRIATDSTTPESRQWQGPTAVSRRLLLLLALLNLLLGPALASARGVTISDVRTNTLEDAVLLSARLEYEFTDKVREAVDGGIPVVLVFKIRVDRPRQYWLAKEVYRGRVRYEIRFHALAERYLVTDLANQKTQQRFRSLEQALEYAGRIQSFRIESRRTGKDLADLKLRLRGGLDIGNLPTPLRLWAYLDQDWYIQSEWYEQPLIGESQ